MSIPTVNFRKHIKSEINHILFIGILKSEYDHTNDSNYNFYKRKYNHGNYCNEKSELNLKNERYLVFIHFRFHSYQCTLQCFIRLKIYK